MTIEAFGAPAVLDELLARLRVEAPAAARIDDLQWHELEAEAPPNFAIIASDAPDSSSARASIPADLAMCDECRAEIHDVRARRYHYPFTNCTHCGPRFTIATSIPYDRLRTTMVGFPLCEACRREYDDPTDRRFHAQPIACPACGPKLTWADAKGQRVPVDDVLELAAHRLRSGAIVALRGLGGFHLACDALDEAAVRELRVRKRRDEKPLAVMVRDLAAARAVATLSAADVALLTSPVRPIVLVPMLQGLAPSIAPGFKQVGLFLPYTPLHELLLERVRRPLVMTSGNQADEPMAIDNDDALARLHGIADGFVLHDRPIATRADDSVTRVVAGEPMVLRRARGYVPQSFEAPVALREPVLAVGGHLKNTFCLGKGTRLTLGPHVGDLSDLATCESFEAMIGLLEHFLEVQPQIIAHDLHPDYDSTRYARQRSSRLIGVQHHHAHVAAVIAEHQVQGEVFGVSFDGAGYGTDGSAWGGEFMRASLSSFERVATMRPSRLAGGERAIRNPWRIALAVLDDAFEGAAPLDKLALFDAVARRDVANVRQVLSAGLQVTQAHGVGRLFDAAAALVLGRPMANFEAQLAMMLEQAATTAEVQPWPFEVDFSVTPWQVDLRPMWRALVEGLCAQLPQAELSARFHVTLGAATATVVRALVERHGRRPVVLSGGCFGNARLAHEVKSRLGELEVVVPRSIPPGDGGLAFGQAAVAAAQLSKQGDH